MKNYIKAKPAATDYLFLGNRFDTLISYDNGTPTHYFYGFDE
jgi:hypothetical protein